MCGVNVVLSKVTNKEEIITSMNKSINHRGPDDQGIWYNNDIAIGMTRLSIIGLEDGHQPFECESLVCVCNGEIYNYLELKNDLQMQGVSFKTMSDCEVIPHLYRKYGTDCFKMLRGMFSICIWDKNNRQLIIARDRVGEKPLYLSRTSKALFITSEIKALTSNNLITPSFNNSHLEKIIEFNWPVDVTQTFINEVERVKPGEYRIFNSEGIEISRNFFWKLKYVENTELTFQSAKTKTLQLLDESIKMRLQSEVPIAVLLSGGIDSSLIAAIASKYNKNINAITVGYKGMPECDERPLVRKFCKDFNIQLHEIELDPSELKHSFKELINFVDEPIPDLSTISQWAIYKKAKDMGFTVLLSGNGGDELFFGYPTHNRAAYMAQEYLSNLYHPNIFKRIGKIFSKLLKSPLKTLKILETYDSERMLKPERSDLDLKISTFSRILTFSPLSELKDCINEESNAIYGMAKFLHQSWLTNNCLQIADKLGMGASVEVRCPFVDQELIDFVNTIPLEINFSKDESKKFLKEISKGLIPDYILKAPKRGFTPPFDDLSYIVTDQKYIKNANNSFQGRFCELLIEKTLSATQKPL